MLFSAKDNVSRYLTAGVFPTSSLDFILGHELTGFPIYKLTSEWTEVTALTFPHLNEVVAHYFCSHEDEHDGKAVCDISGCLHQDDSQTQSHSDDTTCEDTRFNNCTGSFTGKKRNYGLTLLT